jgi:catechol 2,3-dioxygenase-like lactoylglutathione lyase family enzyme
MATRYVPRSMTTNAHLATAHLRVARPTDDLTACVAFYCDGLGLEVIDSFTDHDGFDGVMLGIRGAPYHLELTRKAGHVVGRAPTEDNLLVFYLPDRAAWEQSIARLQAAGHASVPSFNPYWDISGKTFEDPDGYRIVLVNAAYEQSPGQFTSVSVGSQ